MTDLLNLFTNKEQFDKLLILNNASNVATPLDDLAESPGSKKLIAGDKNVGFYGFVKPTEFGQIMVDGSPFNFNGNNLANAVGLSSTSTPLFNESMWMKFSYEGRVQFIPMRPIRNSVAWDDIYRAGAVYGTNTIGELPVQGRRGAHLRMDASDNSLNITNFDSFLTVDPDSGSSQKGFVAQPGETVKIDGFVNPGNNGDFVVISITATKIRLTVPAGVTLVNETGNEFARIYKSSNAVMQNKRVTIGDKTYKVRLIRNSPSPVNPDKSGLNKNEWKDLMLPITLKAITKGWNYAQYAYDVPNWNIGLSDIDLQTSREVVSQNGVYSWTADYDVGASYRRIARGFNGVEYQMGNRAFWNSFILGWRPVLELVDNVEALNVPLNVVPPVIVNTTTNNPGDHQH